MRFPRFSNRPSSASLMSCLSPQQTGMLRTPSRLSARGLAVSMCGGTREQTTPSASLEIEKMYLKHHQTTVGLVTLSEATCARCPIANNIFTTRLPLLKVSIASTGISHRGAALLADANDDSSTYPDHLPHKPTNLRVSTIPAFNSSANIAGRSGRSRKASTLSRSSIGCQDCRMPSDTHLHGGPTASDGKQTLKSKSRRVRSIPKAWGHRPYNLRCYYQPGYVVAPPSPTILATHATRPENVIHSGWYRTRSAHNLGLAVGCCPLQRTPRPLLLSVVGVAIDAGSVGAVVIDLVAVWPRSPGDPGDSEYPRHSQQKSSVTSLRHRRLRPREHSVTGDAQHRRRADNPATAVVVLRFVGNGSDCVQIGHVRGSSIPSPIRLTAITAEA